MLVLDTEDDYDDGTEFNPANHQVREGGPWTIEYIGNIEAKSREMCLQITRSGSFRQPLLS